MIGITVSNVRLGGGLATSAGVIIASAFQLRVESDGGTFEAYGCLVNTINALDSLAQIAETFSLRVLADGGTFEAITCLQTTVNNLQS